jgi:Cu/Ag efflux protein CusF
MKRLSVVLVGLLFVLSTTGLAFAQEKAKAGKPPEATKPAEPAKPAEAVKAEAPKPEAAKPMEAKEGKPMVVKYRMGGLVVALDSAARKITIKQDKVRGERKVTLTVNKKAAKNLAGVKVGDEVNVWVAGRVITELQKVS